MSAVGVDDLRAGGGAGDERRSRAGCDRFAQGSQFFGCVS